MKRYIKPECEIVRMDATNTLLSGSTFINEPGDGKWHAPQRGGYYDDYDDEE